MTDALVIGAGPAGLMAAEMLADAGLSVIVAEAKPSVGRKLLMAGKSGLNLTKDEPFDAFLSNFAETENWLAPSLTAFGPTQVSDWANTLEQEVFTGSTGRVFPKAMKASPLLRNWLARLHEKGVVFQTRWCWIGCDTNQFLFDTPNGRQVITPKTTVLALGGASWARLGANGAWAGIFETMGIPTTSFQPSNMGMVVNWSNHMAPHFGAPLKNIAITAGGIQKRGECVISKSGLEGSLIYQFSRQIREMSAFAMDLLPDQTHAQITAKLGKQSSKVSLSNILRKALRLDGAKAALVMEFARNTPKSEMAAALKALPLSYAGAAPMDGAISVAGGVPQSALDPTFMLTSKQGVFCAGEMLDWEAPTGGYLLTACLATGRTAGISAAKFAGAKPYE